MLIDLVDDLRCPRPHEPTWLVASADRTDGRDIVEGTLGCPICHAEYPIRAGVVWFRRPSGETWHAEGIQPAPDAEAAMRLAAFLDLSDARGFALLAGSWAGAAPLLRDLVPTHLVVLDPTPGIASGQGISALEVETAIPLADAACRGVALDARHAVPAYVDDAVRVLRPRGRLVAPASVPIPAGATELARDGQLWVAERATDATGLVPLRPRGSRP